MIVIVVEQSQPLVKVVILKAALIQTITQHTLMLEELVIGEAVVQLADEETRQERYIVKYQMEEKQMIVIVMEQSQSLIKVVIYRVVLQIHKQILIFLILQTGYVLTKEIL
jgi:hypothetical protein